MLIENGATPRLPILMVDATDDETAETALTVSVQISKNGGAFAATTNSPVEVGNGWYYVILTATETDTDGPLLLRATAAGADEWRDYHQVFTDLSADVIAISGDTTAADNAELAFDGTGYGFTGCTMPTVTTLTGHTPQTGDVYAQLPTNFSDLAITLTTGLVDVNDKTGFSISGTKTTLDALQDLSAADVNTEVDTALADINLDHLVKSAVDTDFPTTVHLDSVIGQMADVGTVATFDRTTDSLEAIRNVEPHGTAMRGTDSAALATVCTEARLSELDAANLPSDIDSILLDTGTTLDNHLTDIKGTGFVKDTHSLPQCLTATGFSTHNQADVADAVWDEAAADHVLAGSFGEEQQAHALSSEISALNNISTAEVLAQVQSALDEAFSDATSLTVNGLKDRLRTLGWILRNKMEVTNANGNTTIYKDDSSTTAFSVLAALVDDSTTTTRLRME